MRSAISRKSSGASTMTTAVGWVAGCPGFAAGRPPDPYQATGVKRQTRTVHGGEVASACRQARRQGRLLEADLISGAGHSLSAAPTTYCGSMWPSLTYREH